MKTFIALALATAIAAPAYSVTLLKADFSGAISGGSANVKVPFSGNGFSPGMGFSGSFVYDADQITVTGTPTNVNFAAIPGVNGFAPADIFSLSFGPLTFDLTDAVSIAPKIQYRNGQFNGFVYVSEFQFQTNWYQLRIEGNVLGVRLLTNIPAPGAPHGFVTGSSLINARLSIGDGNLANIRPFPEAAAVPEPASWGLMIAGFALAGAAMRRRAPAAVRFG